MMERERVGYSKENEEKNTEGKHKRDSCEEITQRFLHITGNGFPTRWKREKHSRENEWEGVLWFRV